MWYNRLTSSLPLRWGKNRLSWFILCAVLLVVGAIGVMAATTHAETIPTIAIVSVDSGKSVNIQTHNYPSNQTFTVRMGKIGTNGVGGTVVGTLQSGAGGSLTASFPIPEALKGEYQIAIRLESTVGYYSFNWFYNNMAAAPPSSGSPGSTPGTVYTGIPTFSVTGVQRDATVSIKTHNFPANRDFKVTMGAMGAKGVNGVVVTTTNSGNGGEFTATYNVPESLKGSYQIAIRLESADGYFAYNWFYNSSAAAGTVTPPATGSPAVPTTPVYVGVPTFSIQGVTRNGNVTILTNNLPPNRDFRVTMGGMGTKGVNGALVTTTNSGAGGALTLTYDIPAALHGSAQIAIRLESADGYYAYNWFYNTSTR
ncbi:MAG: hypothetical protein IAE79_27290 [Anaerolinea sp.]|nr:hypothetical protein [Anaerolinea sp.]